MVPLSGVEPECPAAEDFESSGYTNSPIKAYLLFGSLMQDLNMHFMLLPKSSAIPD